MPCKLILFLFVFECLSANASSPNSSSLKCSQVASIGPSQQLSPLPTEKKALIEYIRHSGSSPKLSQYVENAKVVFVGEHHPNELVRSYLISQLADLKQKGFTSIALEMFNSKDQDLLDRFLKNEASTNDLLIYLQKEWGWKPETYVKLVEEAKRLKMKVIALDDRSEGHSPLRDPKMANELADFMVRQPVDKVLVLIGGVHASLQTTRTMHSLFKSKTGIPTFGLMIDWKNETNRNHPDWFPNESIDALVGDAFDSSGITDSIVVRFEREKYFFDAYLFQSEQN